MNALQAGPERNATRRVLQEHSGRIALGNAIVQMECTVIHLMENASAHQERKDTNARKPVKMGCLVQVVRVYVPARMVEFVTRLLDLVSVELDGEGRSVIDHVRMEDSERGVMRFVIVLLRTTPPSTIPSLPVVTTSLENAVALLDGLVLTAKHHVLSVVMVKDAVILANVPMELPVTESQDSATVHLDIWGRIVKMSVLQGYGDRIV